MQFVFIFHAIFIQLPSNHQDFSGLGSLHVSALYRCFG